MQVARDQAPPTRCVRTRKTHSLLWSFSLRQPAVSLPSCPPFKNLHEGTFPEELSRRRVQAVLMCAPMSRIWPLLLLLLPGVQHVSAIEIHTASEMEAVNGTNVKLKCTFTSTHTLSPQSVTVSWNFRPINSGSDESVFYYQEVPYPPQQGRFKGHAVWSGDISRGDASITLHEVPPTFNGTFICQVRNRPDVHGRNGEIVLRVVEKASLSEIGILAAAVGGSCAVILIIFGIFVAVRFYRRRRMENDIEMRPREQEWKDPTVW